MSLRSDHTEAVRLGTIAQVQVYLKDMDCLDSGAWLNDNIINARLRYMCSTCNHTVLFDSLSFGSIFMGDDVTTSGSHVDITKAGRIISKAWNDLSSFTSAIVVVNRDYHWYC